MRKCDIYRYQEQGMWKDKFAPENARSAVSFSDQAAIYNCQMAPEKGRGTTAVSIGGFETVDTTAERLPRKAGDQRWFQSAVLKPPNQPQNQTREINQSGMIGGFERR